MGGSECIVVYDILGREVATLVNHEHNSGNYEVTFDAYKFTSGVFFYKLTAGDFIDAKKNNFVKENK
ncbi:MAG: T9SS type A sorting domain-containing protein [Bacteroidetes bacterium]|nr:T9SS type A sorting domain-containing protein [Bacteroidota bacterium]MBU1113666.1 T9SS type A sorting domain-containing protein [Bacteroidota bacterium]MBU1796748.1 T9SS type A sorting domain-containing protein [Bacteroidota bacterium]